MVENMTIVNGAVDVPPSPVALMVTEGVPTSGGVPDKIPVVEL